MKSIVQAAAIIVGFIFFGLMLIVAYVTLGCLYLVLSAIVYLIVWALNKKRPDSFWNP